MQILQYGVRQSPPPDMIEFFNLAGEPTWTVED